MNIERLEVMQTDQFWTPTLDCVKGHRCGQIPFQRCCLSYRRTVTRSEHPFPLAACQASLGFHPPSSPPTLIPQWSESAMPQPRGSSWQRRPAVPWPGDTNRPQILARNTTVAAIVIKETESKYQGTEWHRIDLAGIWCCLSYCKSGLHKVSW